MNRTLNGINKLCIASNNRKSKASSVSRLKEAFHNSERLLLKLREDECRKEEKRINDLKGKQMLLLQKKAEKAKKETERLALKELKEQEKLAEKKKKRRRKGSRQIEKRSNQGSRKTSKSCGTGKTRQRKGIEKSSRSSR